MPKTVEEFEIAMLYAFKDGLVQGYAVDHEDIRNEELSAAIDFCEKHSFRYYGRLNYPPMFDFEKHSS